jgi:hypothetical protein
LFEEHQGAFDAECDLWGRDSKVTETPISVQLGKAALREIEAT